MGQNYSRFIHLHLRHDRIPRLLQLWLLGIVGTQKLKFIFRTRVSPKTFRAGFDMILVEYDGVPEIYTVKPVKDIVRFFDFFKENYL